MIIYALRLTTYVLPLLRQRPDASEDLITLEIPLEELCYAFDIFTEAERVLREDGLLVLRGAAVDAWDEFSRPHIIARIPD